MANPPQCPSNTASKREVHAWIIKLLLYNGFDKKAAHTAADKNQGHVGVLRLLTREQMQLKFGQEEGAFIHEAVIRPPPTPPSPTVVKDDPNVFDPAKQTWFAKLLWKLCG
ncbi:MAG: hypothetical protein M1827_001964 [Pycnora praestabilis]|nr:MAG: hypothetical protein M1827_001964 [Pycnora praestabilis]